MANTLQTPNRNAVPHQSKRMYIVFEHPRLSDAESHECDHGLIPYARYSKLLGWHALEQLGGLLADYTGWPAPVAQSKIYNLALVILHSLTSSSSAIRTSLPSKRVLLCCSP